MLFRSSGWPDQVDQGKRWFRLKDALNRNDVRGLGDSGAVRHAAPLSVGLNRRDVKRVGAAADGFDVERAFGGRNHNPHIRQDNKRT